MPTEIERLSTTRIYIVAALGLTYIFFQFFSLEFVALWTGWDETTLEWLENIGTIAYVAAILAFALLYLKARQIGESAKTELHDELVKHNFNQTMIFSFKFLFILAFSIFIICQFVDLIGEDVARIMMTASFGVPYLRFAYLEIKDA